MNGQFRFVPFITVAFMTAAMKHRGGRIRSLIPSKKRNGYGTPAEAVSAPFKRLYPADWG